MSTPGYRSGANREIVYGRGDEGGGGRMKGVKPVWRARRDMAGHGGPSGESVLRCPPSVLGGIRDPEPVAVNDTAFASCPLASSFSLSESLLARGSRLTVTNVHLVLSCLAPRRSI